MKSIMPSGRNGFPAIEPESVAEAINPQTPKETTGYLGDEPSLFLLMPFPALSLEFLPPLITPADEEPSAASGRQNLSPNEPNKLNK